MNRSASDATLVLVYVPAAGTPGAGGPAVARDAARRAAVLRSGRHRVPRGERVGAPVGRLRQARDVLRDVRRRVRPGCRLRRIAHVHAEPLGLRRRRVRNVRVGRSVGRRDRVRRTPGSTACARTRRSARTSRSSTRPARPRARRPVPSRSRSSSTTATAARPSGAPLTHTLQPGEFFQYNQVLSNTSTGVTNGYARAPAHVRHRPLHRVRRRERRRQRGRRHLGRQLPRRERDGGPDPDPPRPARTARTSRRDLTLTNPTSAPVTVTLTYTAAAAFSGQGSGTRTIDARRAPAARAGERALLPARSRARDSRDGQPGRHASRLGRRRPGAHVEPESRHDRRRLLRPVLPGGRVSARARDEAWVYGLRQDANVRSNLAIADARDRRRTRRLRPRRLRRRHGLDDARPDADDRAGRRAVEPGERHPLRGGHRARLRARAARVRARRTSSSTAS